MEATENQNPTTEAPAPQAEAPQAEAPENTPEATERTETTESPETTETESAEPTESAESTNRHAELPAGEVAELSELPVVSELSELSAPRLQNTQGSQNSQPSRLEAAQPLLSAAEVEQRVAEAEERGYLRGRNEQIEQLMHSPGVFQRVADTDGGVAAAATAGNFTDNDSEIMVLSHPRVSIWDK
jgi:hypothetical protein